MATDWIKESAEERIRNCLLVGIGLLVLGSASFSAAISADESNPWVVLIGALVAAAGQLLALVAIIAWGVRLGNEATTKPRP